MTGTIQSNSENPVTARSKESLEKNTSPLSNISVNTVKDPIASDALKCGTKAEKSIPSDSTDSSVHLPIAARFTRRASIVSQVPTRHVPCHDEERFQPKSRDFSNGTTASAIDSGEETDSSNAPHTRKSAHNQLHFSQKANSSHSHTTTASSQYDGSSTIGGSLAVPRVFKHRLRTLAPLPPNKLYKGSNGQGIAAARNSPLILPNSLRIIGENIVECLLPGHSAMSERLRVRYEEQYRNWVSLWPINHTDRTIQPLCAHWQMYLPTEAGWWNITQHTSCI